MNLRIVFKDCKLQFYEKRLFSYFIVNTRTPASRWRRLLKLKRKKLALLRLSLASLSPTTILSNKGLHFVCLLIAKNYQMHSKA